MTLRFSDASTDRENRIHVAERLREATLPDGVEALIGPQATPVGQIYRYTLSGPRTLRELRSIQDWVVERRLRSVPGVADVEDSPAALVEEAVSVGDLVRIFDFQQGNAAMAEITLPADNPNVGRRVGDIAFPQDTLLVGIIRDGRPIGPSADDSLEAHDELLLLTTAEAEPELEAMMRPGGRTRKRRTQ